MCVCEYACVCACVCMTLCANMYICVSVYVLWGYLFFTKLSTCLILFWDLCIIWLCSMYILICWLYCLWTYGLFLVWKLTESTIVNTDTVSMKFMIRICGFRDFCHHHTYIYVKILSFIDKRMSFNIRKTKLFYDLI